jgi:hypothetical protein
MKIMYRNIVKNKIKLKKMEVLNEGQVTICEELHAKRQLTLECLYLESLFFEPCKKLL